MQKLYYNGTILTMEEPLRQEAVLVEDGRILFAGSLEAANHMAKPKAKRIDLEGNTMLPAFLDPHSHFSAAANATFQVPLEECVSHEEIKERIKRFIKEQNKEPGEWILAKGYDHNLYEGARQPSLAVLDEAAPHNPLILQHKSGHFGVLNTAAMKAFSITPETQAPQGGKIEIKEGKLTGYMEENAFLKYLNQVPMPSLQDFAGAYEKTQRLYASHGITTVQEGFFAQQLSPMYRYLIDSQALYLDLVGYMDPQAKEEILSAFPEHVNTYKNHFKLGGYKIFLDGSPQGRTAWMRAPYQPCDSGQPADYCGYPTMTDEKVEDALRLAASDKLQLLAHCNGDAACQQYLQACENTLSANEAQSIRPVMIHAQLLDYDQIGRLLPLSMIPSFFVAHVYHWGDTHIRNFGFSRAQRISPAGKAKELGLPFTFHQDTPVIPPDMLETVWCAVNRQTKEGVLLGPAERLDPLSALKAVTIHAAYQYFEENEKGSIRAGKSADFVILDRDPLSVPPMEIRDIQVLATIKAGETIFTQN